VFNVILCPSHGSGYCKKTYDVSLFLPGPPPFLVPPLLPLPLQGLLLAVTTTVGSLVPILARIIFTVDIG